MLVYPSMIKLAAVLLLVPLLSMLPSALAAPPVMPFDEVRAGMRGKGLTVFAGDRIESFDVEILGTLPGIAPGRDLILARCSGGPLERTGVLAGMSGSPVTVDDRLVGAVAYSWGFSTEAIAGITPIGEMLEIPTLDDGRRAAAASAPRAADWARLGHPEAIPSFLDARLAGLLRAGGSPFPLAVPLSVAGPGAGAGAASWQRWSAAGFLPVQAGSAGSAAGSPGSTKSLEPGSAVGLKLVRGDVEVAATGTVTWVDRDRVLAFGHPFLSLGAVDLPLTTASVRALLPSLRQSARLAVPVAEVGTLRQDRAAGVYGRLAGEARMIPVRMQLETPDAGERSFAFDIADDPLLSPLLLYSVLGGVLAGRERSVGSASLRLREGSTIKLGDGSDVRLDNLYSGPTAMQHATGMAAYILHLLMNNAWSRPDIDGINLIYEYDPEPREGRIRRVGVDRYRVRAGEPVQVTVLLEPFRGPAQVLTREIRIPDETAPGELTIQVGGVGEILRDERGEEPLFPRDLAHLVQLVNQLRRNDGIYILAIREENAFAVEGNLLPDLPPSAIRILGPHGDRGDAATVPRRLLAEEAILTDTSVTGGARVRLEVTAR